MRIKSFIHNSIFSISSCIIVVLTGFITRRVFLQTFSAEYLGYEGLFSNIFSLLSLAELGISNVISYKLFKELAEDNTVEIAKLMAIYRYIYKVIGLLVACIGVGLLFILPLIIQEDITDWRYVYFIYIGQLIIVLCSYFLSSRRTLLLADQKEYIAVKIDTTVSTAASVLRLIALAGLKSYAIYLLIGVASNIVANVIVHCRSGKQYPYLRNRVTITKHDLEKRNLTKEIKDFSLVKMAALIYGATDNVIITLMLGVYSVTLLSNYTYIFSNVQTIILRITSPLQAGIGSLVNDTHSNRGEVVYWGLDTLFMFIGAFTSVCFFVLMEPFVTMWVGNKFLLPVSCLASLCINSYIAYVGSTVCMYRTAFGNYHEDRTAMIWAAVSNLILSIVLVQTWGLTGIVIGTIVGHLFFQYARIKYVFKNYLRISAWPYVCKHIVFAGVVCLEIALVYHLTYHMPTTIVGLIMRLGVCVVVPNAINVVLLCRTQGFQTIIAYAKQIIHLICGYISKHRSGKGLH